MKKMEILTITIIIIIITKVKIVIIAIIRMIINIAIWLVIGIMIHVDSQFSNGIYDNKYNIEYKKHTIFLKLK